LKEALSRFDQRKSQPESESRPIPSISPNKTRNKIAFPENGRIHFIEVEDIMYLESSNVYTLCHLREKATIVVSKSLSSYLEVLPAPAFCRIHERYIVNLNFVKTYTKGRGGEVELKNGSTLPVASRRKDLFLKQIEQLSIG
ncbi:MAG: LytTR family DNA-binding domain-containing protein, partial [Bacteroidota bacterium]